MEGISPLVCVAEWIEAEAVITEAQWRQTQLDMVLVDGEYLFGELFAFMPLRAMAEEVSDG